MRDNIALSARSAPSLDLMGIRQFPRDKQKPGAVAIRDAVKIRVIESLKQKFSPAEREVWNSVTFAKYPVALSGREADIKKIR
jgi:hypothetical protein